MKHVRLVKFSLDELFTHGKELIEQMAFEETEEDFRQYMPTLEVKSFHFNSLEPNHVEEETGEIYFRCNITVVL